MANVAWWCADCEKYYTPKTKKSKCVVCGSTEFIREWDESEYQDPKELDFENDTYNEDYYYDE